MIIKSTQSRRGSSGRVNRTVYIDTDTGRFVSTEKAIAAGTTSREAYYREAAGEIYDKNIKVRREYEKIYDEDIKPSDSQILEGAAKEADMRRKFVSGVAEKEMYKDLRMEKAEQYRGVPSKKEIAQDIEVFSDFTTEQTKKANILNRGLQASAETIDAKILDDMGYKVRKGHIEKKNPFSDDMPFRDLLENAVYDKEAKRYNLRVGGKIYHITPPGYTNGKYEHGWLIEEA